MKYYHHSTIEKKPTTVNHIKVRSSRNLIGVDKTEVERCKPAPVSTTRRYILQLF